MAEPIYDIHPHIISDDEGRYPHSPIGGVKSDYAKERPITVEQYVAAMDEAGVAKAAIVQSSTCYGFNNSYLVDSIAKYPGRLTGVACVDVNAAGAAATVRKLHSQGIAGIRLYTGGSKMAFDISGLDNPASYESWETCGELGMPVCIQSRTIAIPAIRSLAERFPGTKILLDHLLRVDVSDGPPYAAAQVLFDLSANKNIYLKTTPRTFDDLAKSPKGSTETFFPKLIEVFGADHIAYGSNYPSSEGSLSEIAKQARDGLSSLPTKDRHNIFVGTTQILYPALAD